MDFWLQWKNSGVVVESPQRHRKVQVDQLSESWTVASAEVEVFPLWLRLSLVHWVIQDYPCIVVFVLRDHSAHPMHLSFSAKSSARSPRHLPLLYSNQENTDTTNTKSDDVANETSDYLLQTDDYSNPNPWRRRVAVNWDQKWDHHHHATVKLVRPKHYEKIQLQKKQQDEGHVVHLDIDLPVVENGRSSPNSRQHIPEFLTSIMNLNKGNQLVSRTAEWQRLKQHAKYIKQETHLRDLMQDEERCDELYATHDGVYLDYSRQRVTGETMELLFELAEKQQLKERIDAMVTGDKINFTEKRAVLHTALRSKRYVDPVIVDGENVIEQVHGVLDQIRDFTNGVRSGTIRGYTGKRLRNIVSVGIGGSYLGPEFLHECLKTEPEGIHASLGYNLRFLANVDPVDVERTCADLDPEETLIVVVSKTFTTAETMLNARTMRQWLWDFMGDDPEVVKKHVVACSSVSATDKVKDFGIDTDNYFFRFWDWVGGRYSVCSAAGAVPISLLYGFDIFEKFLAGARSMDEHFTTAPMEENIPVIMGMLGVWNLSFLNYQSRTTLPYAEALLKLPAHIQQLDMESNGKAVTKDGLKVDYRVGEIDFGEAGTNGQHSFYQLLHMGQTVPCDFIGFCESQHDFCVDDESLSSHDELMANFFAQPDALANGKTEAEIRAEGEEDENIIPHRVFTGNRPSLSLLLPKLTSYACGQLLALYEHRTAVQGFIWDINSFDQYGVELGKKLALGVKDSLQEGRRSGNDVEHASNKATKRFLNYYLQNSNNSCEEIRGNPLTRVTRTTHHDHARAKPQPPHRHDLGGHGGKL